MLGPLFAVAGVARSCAPRLGGAGSSSAALRTGRPLHLCDLSDHALSPRDRRAAGSDRADPRRRAIYPGPRQRREPERACQRQDMLREAIEVIRALRGGGLVDWRGDYSQVDSARLWDQPDVPVGLAVAM